MGVVYKLKKEVIDFITHRKNENPQISCRQLVKVVQQEFQLKLSKSSINTILKGAQLSSPIGRRAAAVFKAKKFKIPESKKQQIFPPLSKTIIAEKTDEDGIKIKTLPLEESKILSKSPETETRRSSQPEISHDGLGSIFLKAAQWEMAERSILGKLLEENSGLTDIKNFDGIGEAFLFMQLFEIKDIMNYKGTGLWAINNLEDQNEIKNSLIQLKELNDLSRLDINLEIELSQLVTNISAIEIILEDGSKIQLDPILFTFIKENVQSEQAGFQTVITSINTIVNNVQSVNIYSINEKLLTELSNLFLSFSNERGKKIQKISAINHDGSILLTFDKIIEKNRFFTLGIWPDQEIFKGMLKFLDDKAIKPYEDQLTQSKGYYQEIPLQLGDLGLSLPMALNTHGVLRGVIVWKELNQMPEFILISNEKTQNKTGESIIINWRRRWPHKNGFPQQIDIKRVTETMQSETSASPGIDNKLAIMSLTQILLKIIKQLHEFCAKNYFCLTETENSFETLSSNIYSLPGTLEQSLNYLIVTLPPCPNSQLNVILDLAKNRVNLRSILDFKGRRLIIK